MEPNETADIRRALDRLQQAFELLNDRYRDMRRERKQLREQIEELQRERQMAEVARATEAEMAAGEKERAAEFEERARVAEGRYEELTSRVAELERAVTDREALIAEQEDLLVQMRADLESQRKREEEGWIEEQRMREESEALRRLVAQMQAEAEELREQMQRLSSVPEGSVVVAAEEVKSLQAANASLRQMIELQLQERSELEGKHHQAIGKLDAATRAEAMARTEITVVEAEKQALEATLASLNEAHEKLKESLRENGLDQSLAIQAHGAELEARELELKELHERIAQREKEHALRLSGVEERLAAMEMERERLEHQLAVLKEERDNARATAERLQGQLKEAEYSDDDRLKAQRVRMEELARDLSNALELAARREKEVAAMAEEQESLHARIARLTTEVEQLRAMGAMEKNGADLSDDVRHALAAQIDDAVRLIDKHLAGKSGQ